MEIKATIVAMRPYTGISEPKSKPKTKIAPINPVISIHCLILIFHLR